MTFVVVSLFVTLILFFLMGHHEKSFAVSLDASRSERYAYPYVFEFYLACVPVCS